MSFFSKQTKDEDHVDFLNSLPVDPPLKLDLSTSIQMEQLRAAKAEANLNQLAISKMQMSMRPSRNFAVGLSHDGMRWVVTLQAAEPRSTVVAYGDYPEEAMINFDRAWLGMKDEETK